MLLTLLALALSGVAHAEDAWTTEAVELQRWPAGTEGSVVVRSLDAGSQVVIVTELGEQVRVYTNGTHGWINKSLLTDEAPAPTDEADEADVAEDETPAEEAEAAEDELPFDER
ncbi:MAG: hypothetical protein H6741_35380 [Alphaproteobacteria bacterium]|nr:hypothetical protein [Alphaproteobacteria bacterium]